MKHIDLTLLNINIKNNCELAVVIPIYNESACIGQVLEEWSSKLQELLINYLFIIVNDESTDNSVEIIDSFSNVIIINKINSGHGRSIRHGYDFALNNTNCKFILQIDSDGQCRPEDFDIFWNERGNFEFILGQRKNRGDGVSRFFISYLSSLLCLFVTKKFIRDANTPFRLFSKKILNECLIFIPKSFDIHNTAITYTLSMLFKKIKRVEIKFPNRIGGENSINSIKIFQMGFNMLFDLYFLVKKLKKTNE